MNCVSQERDFLRVDTTNATAIKQEVLRIFRNLFPGSSTATLDKAFTWVCDAFSGHYADYQAIDAKYHDFEHTMQGTLCYVRLLEGYQQAGAQPSLTARMFELAVIAILLHDTGYLKKRGDTEGTGAKYTLTHVTRSAEFAARLLTGQDFAPSEVLSVQNMIRCTGVNADLKSIPFQSEMERKLGFALGTADLLGQMAADDYIDKLGILFQEFEESNRFSHRTAGPGVFQTAADLRRNTPVFWEKYVIPKINGDFAGLYHFLDRSGENAYVKRIRANIARLESENSRLAA